MQTRRGFLKLVGIAVGACVAGPVLKKIAAAEPQVARKVSWDLATDGDFTRYHLVMGPNQKRAWFGEKPFDPVEYMGEVKWIENPDLMATLGRAELTSYVGFDREGNPT